MAFKGSPSSQHQHCTDEAQKAETVLSAVIYIYIYHKVKDDRPGECSPEKDCLR